MKILVTGASGFLGTGLLSRLLSDSAYEVAIASRRPSGRVGVEEFLVADLKRDTSWAVALARVEVLVHTAARVHIRAEDEASDPLAVYRAVNVEGTLNLAQQAASAGVRRFVFVSSIKVNGESTEPGCPFSADDPPNPGDPYSISKMEAEQQLRAVASRTGMEVVIVRPPLVYGPGVKANFLSMMRWLGHSIPMPFGLIQNQRSLVALDNLVDLIVRCIDHPAAANQTFLVSDGDDVSTPELFRRLGEALGNPAILLPVPSVWLTVSARLLGQPGLAQRLCGSLQVDISKTRAMLGWEPPCSMQDELQKTVEAFRGEARACTVPVLSRRSGGRRWYDW